MAKFVMFVIVNDERVIPNRYQSLSFDDFDECFELACKEASCLLMQIEHAYSKEMVLSDDRCGYDVYVNNNEQPYATVRVIEIAN